MILNIIKKIGFIPVLSIFIISCQDLKFGDAFLAKPPAGDLNIDDIYSNADYARRALWGVYHTLPLGIPIRNEFWDGATMTVGANGKLNGDVLECLTDLNYSTYGYANVGSTMYHSGNISATIENTSPATKYSYLGKGGEDNWIGIRRGYLFIENVDRVPDMTEQEKTMLKAEAKVIIAIHYVEMFRHFGGLPWIDHAYATSDLTGVIEKERETALQTLNNIVDLLDEAAADLPWTIADPATWDGRITKAAAMGVKARILLFAASPLFNNAEPYMQGEASEKHLTWFGGYMPELWERARKAHEDFFNEMESRGGYGLITPSGNYRQAWTDAYFERGGSEIVFSMRTNQFRTGTGYYNDPYWWLFLLGDYGCSGPTQEWVDMYPMVNGKSIFDSDSGWDPDYPYRNRDPRLYESIATTGDVYNVSLVYSPWLGIPELGIPVGLHNQKYNTYGHSKTGYRLRKFILDGTGNTAQMLNRVFHYPYLRLPELYYGYAEAICMSGGDMNKAYDMANAPRKRVGVGGIKPGLTGKDFVDALLDERVCELAFEEVRWHDIVRWKREDILRKPLHWVEVTIKDPSENPNFVSFNYDYQPILPERYWVRNFTPKWYLSAFPSDELNKGYGLIQNPGW